MAQSKHKRATATPLIYRSRQDGRTDMEELLAPNFDPAARPMPRPALVGELAVSATVVDSATVSVAASIDRPNGFINNHLNQRELGTNQVVATTVVSPASVAPSTTEDATPTAVAASTLVDAAAVAVPTDLIGDNGVDLERTVDTAEPFLSTTVRESTTVVASATIVASGTEPEFVLQIVKQDKIAQMAQGLKPKELADTWIALTTGVTYPAKLIHQVNIAQDSMTTGQERFYEGVWHSKGDRKFRHTILSKDVRQFSAGYDVLSRVGRLAPRNVQNAIPALIAKQALFSYKNYVSEIRKGSTYRIFSYDEILRRQKALGLCYVVRNGPSVEFAAPVGWTVDAATVAVSTTVAAASVPSPVVAPTVSVDAPAPLTVDATPTPLDSGILTRQTTSTDLRQLLQKLLPTFDDDAVRTIWQACRSRVPDVTPEEITQIFLDFIQESMRKLRPNGFLLTAVPTACTQARVNLIRDQQRQADEDAEGEAPLQSTPDSRASTIELLQKMIEMSPTHPQVASWRQSIRVLLGEGN